MKNKISAVIMAVVAAVWSANAAEWYVYATETDGMTGVQQLTNAFKRAVSGDTITIHAGTYHMTDICEIMDKYYTTATQTEYGEAGTCYYTMTPNLTIQGDPAVTPDQVVLSGAGSSTDDYGKLRVMHLGGENCTVRNLTFLKGNCHVDRYVNGDSQGWNYKRGGGLCLSKASSSVSNCIFQYCYAQQGAAVSGGNVYDCKFLNCMGKQTVLWPKQVSGCEFDGANIAIQGASGPISNCRFVNCGGDSGVISESDVSVSDCEFSGCSKVCVKNCTMEISGCRFQGSVQFLDNCAKVVNCDFKPNGSTWTGSTSVDVTPVNKCGLENCRFEGFSIHWGSVITDPIYMRNCLVTGSICWGQSYSGVFYFTSAFDGGSDIANCTIVGNQGNAMLWNHGTGSITMRNMLFSNNTIGGQNLGVCDFWDTDLSSVTFYNCKVKAGGLVDGNRTKQELNGNSENLWNKSFDPKFANDVNADSLYTLHRSSPCVDAGMNEDWMIASTDLAGSERINGAAVDIGCYEYIRRLGTMLMLR